MSVKQLYMNVGLDVASCWPAHSKLGVEPWELCEGIDLVVPRQRAPREAGFTEQRSPLALDSGGITGFCTSNPMSLASLSLEPSPFLFF
ncbi:unnamed protein product [Sphenostylis stenocarpa]|uniref:Uncharacterized protein n=1 Tax=Sphenostylis stenocarpa TaxID=92480 RepID=A0AA86SLV5_9FABA|nr:unnamed protein product [Sphenostylis stenocarpa]